MPKIMFAATHSDSFDEVIYIKIEDIKRVVRHSSVRRHIRPWRTKLNERPTKYTLHFTENKA